MIEIVPQVNLSNLKKTYDLLDKAIKQSRNELERLGAAHCFKCSFELALKILKQATQADGKDQLRSPRAVLRDAAQNQIITDPELWFKFLEHRNATLQSYNEPVLDRIFKMLPEFRDEVKKLIAHLETRS